MTATVLAAIGAVALIAGALWLEHEIRHAPIWDDVDADGSLDWVVTCPVCDGGGWVSGLDLCSWRAAWHGCAECWGTGMVDMRPREGAT